MIRPIRGPDPSTQREPRLSHGEERRQHVRLENSLPVMYWMSPHDEAPKQSLTKNLSGGGVCLYLDAPIDQGAQLQVQMRLPGRPAAIAFTAEVAWCDPRTADGRPVMAGLRFIDIAHADQQEIIRYCMQRVPRAGA